METTLFADCGIIATIVWTETQTDTDATDVCRLVTTIMLTTEKKNRKREAEHLNRDSMITFNTINNDVTAGHRKRHT